MYLCWISRADRIDLIKPISHDLPAMPGLTYFKTGVGSFFRCFLPSGLQQNDRNAETQAFIPFGGDVASDVVCCDWL